MKRRGGTLKQHVVACDWMESDHQVSGGWQRGLSCGNNKKPDSLSTLLTSSQKLGRCGSSLGTINSSSIHCQKIRVLEKEISKQYTFRKYTFTENTPIENTFSENTLLGNTLWPAHVSSSLRSNISKSILSTFSWNLPFLHFHFKICFPVLVA